MSVCSWSGVVVSLTVAYLAYNCYTVYTIFNPPHCSRTLPQSRCITPKYPQDVPLALWVFASTTPTVQSSTRGMETIFHKEPLLRLETISETVEVNVPLQTLQNGSLYAHVYLGREGKSPLHRDDVISMSTRVVPLTKYSVVESKQFNLLYNDHEQNGKEPRIETHWIPWLSVHSLDTDFDFDRQNTPNELIHMLRIAPNTQPTQYLPILYVDRLKVRKKELKHISPTNGTVSLEMTYAPLSIGKLRLALIFSQAMEQMKQLGFTDKEFDDVRGIFLDTNLWLFSLTLVISVFHLLFDFLAFKNDINFWRHRKTTVGLSTRTILWRCFSQTVVFLYLLEEQTSLLILVPSGIAAVIELWKVLKVFKVSLVWQGCIPNIQRGEVSKTELETELYDSEAMNKLSYLLWPLVLAGALYQLMYMSYRSWYSWVVHSLVNGVYAFGFLFMLPQLFLNYKMKSVAHLPWRAFMYKAFNTFIDDVFAFIITMPTTHRIAVFRDDLIFMIYLYQKWLYPVDRSRVNEYGESFEGQSSTKEHLD